MEKGEIEVDPRRKQDLLLKKKFNKVRRFHLRTNFMAIIASFTHIRSSYIATINTFYERKSFCWTIICVERQAKNYFKHSSKWVAEKKKKMKKTLPNARQKKDLKIYLDNILNNLWLHTKTNNLDSCLKDSFCFLASRKQTSLVCKTPRWPLRPSAGNTFNFAVNLKILVKSEVPLEKDSCWQLFCNILMKWFFFPSSGWIKTILQSNLSLKKSRTLNQSWERQHKMTNMCGC